MVVSETSLLLVSPPKKNTLTMGALLLTAALFSRFAVFDRGAALQLLHPPMPQPASLEAYLRAARVLQDTQRPTVGLLTGKRDMLVVAVTARTVDVLGCAWHASPDPAVFHGLRTWAARLGYVCTAHLSEADQVLWDLTGFDA